jgi:hypothetical protein
LIQLLVIAMGHDRLLLKHMFVHYKFFQGDP